MKNIILSSTNMLRLGLALICFVDPTQAMFGRKKKYPNWERIGKYMVDPKRLGKGGFGEVHKAHEDGKEELLYALKKVEFESRSDRKMAMTEANMLKKLHHKNIIEYRDAFEADDGIFCLVMSLADGGDLAHRIRE